ncbi:MAG TPA: hypothetical protein VGL47_03300 [Amycolatopsis sp.]|uniref:hypothetical protein n=1 Tax=Amycolatopsis sp. TaxID=37632 RepID=UPI002F3F0891
MTEPAGGRIVVSRTAGRPWILAVVLLVVASGFLWMALAATQESPRVAGWVFGGGFGLLGLNLVRRSVRRPVRDELVLDPAGISRVIGGVVWTVRWDELRAASVVESPRKSEGHQVVLSPARDGFESRHRSLVRIGGGDFLVAGIGLDDREAPRVREVLARHIGATVDRVVEAPVLARPPSPVRDAVPSWMPPPLEATGSVTIHVNAWNRALLRWGRLFALMVELGLGAAIEFGPRNGIRTACLVVFAVVFAGATWLEIAERQSRSRKFRVTLELSAAGIRWVSRYRRIEVAWPEIAELRTPARLVEFRPASDGFPLDRPDLHPLRQADGWYRFPRALSATAAREFDEHIREVLPGGVAWAPPTPITRGAT